MNDQQPTREEVALGQDPPAGRSLVSSRAFADAAASSDWERCERWAAIAFGLVALTRGEPADA